MSPRTARVSLVLLVLGFGLFTPVALRFLGRGASVSPAEAMAALAAQPEKTLLVDIRQGSVYGAVPVPGVLQAPDPAALDPQLLRSKEKVFLICDTGCSSAAAVRKLRQHGADNVFNVAGGAESWIGGQHAACRTSRPVCGTGGADAVRRNRLTRLEQVAICVASFGLKPLYELMALVIGVVIWKWPESHWRTLRWAMLAFFVGENACAVNYLFYGLENFTWEFWHCYGMLVAFGLTMYALLDVVDHQVIRYSSADKTCALVGLCTRCCKYKPVACNVWILSLALVPALLILCCMPLVAPFRNFASIGAVFGSDVLFTHSLLQQLFEIRIYPVLAMVCLGLAWIQLLRGREAALVTAKPALAAGIGILGFSMLRFALFWAYADNILWAEAWEEITEFIFVLGVVLLACLRRAAPAAGAAA